MKRLHTIPIAECSNLETSGQFPVTLVQWFTLMDGRKNLSSQSWNTPEEFHAFFERYSGFKVQPDATLILGVALTLESFTLKATGKPVIASYDPASERFTVLDPADLSRAYDLPASALESPHGRMVRRYSVEREGFDHGQYFRGASSNGFEEVFVGIGNSESEAYADALDMLGQSEWTSTIVPETDSSMSTHDEVGEELASQARPRRYRVRFLASCGMENELIETDDASEALDVLNNYARTLSERGQTIEWPIVAPSVADLETSPCYSDGSNEYGDILASYTFEARDTEDSVMVSDDNGTLIFEVLAGDSDDSEYGSENELHVYVSIRVSEEPEESDGEHTCMFYRHTDERIAFRFDNNLDAHGAMAGAENLLRATDPIGHSKFQSSIQHTGSFDKYDTLMVVECMSYHGFDITLSEQEFEVQ